MFVHGSMLLSTLINKYRESEGKDKLDKNAWDNYFVYLRMLISDYDANGDPIFMGYLNLPIPLPTQIRTSQFPDGYLHVIVYDANFFDREKGKFGYQLLEEENMFTLMKLLDRNGKPSPVFQRLKLLVKSNKEFLQELEKEFEKRRKPSVGTFYGKDLSLLQLIEWFA
jgi:hypothetical protein